jgi:hypothetical protein
MTERLLNEPLALPPLVLAQDGSDLEDRLEEDRLVAQRRRLDHGPVTRLGLRRSRFKNHGSFLMPANTPHGAATPYQDTNWEILAPPSNLHLSVREAEPQDRRVSGEVVSHRRASESSSGREAAARGNSPVLRRQRETCRARRSERTRALLRVLDALDMHGVDSVLRDSALRNASHRPERSSTAHRLADRRRRASGEVVFVVPVRKADHERLCRHASVMSVFANLKLLSPSRLQERLLTEEVAEPGTLSSTLQRVSAAVRELLGELRPTGAPVLGVLRNIRTGVAIAIRRPARLA